MGFGHRVYKVYDPRATYLKTFAEKIATDTGNERLFRMSKKIEDIMFEAVGAKGIHPNVDFYSATTYHCLGLDLTCSRPSSPWLACQAGLDTASSTCRTTSSCDRAAITSGPTACRTPTSPIADPIVFVLLPRQRRFRRLLRGRCWPQTTPRAARRPPDRGHST